MQAVLKIILILCELIKAFSVRREVVKRDEEIESIRNDPAGSFINEFGGVRDDPSEAGVPGNQASVEVGTKE